jgi:hypothetical protein
MMRRLLANVLQPSMGVSTPLSADQALSQELHQLNASIAQIHHTTIVLEELRQLNTDAQQTQNEISNTVTIYLIAVTILTTMIPTTITLYDNYRSSPYTSHLFQLIAAGACFIFGMTGFLLQDRVHQLNDEFLHTLNAIAIIKKYFVNLHHEQDLTHLLQLGKSASQLPGTPRYVYYLISTLASVGFAGSCFLVIGSIGRFLTSLSILDYAWFYTITLASSTLTFILFLLIFNKRYR